MKIKTNTIIVIMVTFCFTASIFLVRPTQSQTTKTYDPLADINEDGKVSLQDLVLLANAYGTNGTPINITDLQGQIIALQNAVNSINATLTAALNDSVTNLQGNLSSLQTQVSALEGNYSITNLNLAPYAIPFNMTESDIHQSTTYTASFQDMPDTSVTLTLNRTSQLIIMFSADAGISAASADQSVAIYCQAMINGVAATPNSIQLTPLISVTSPSGLSHSHHVIEGAFGFNFYFGPVSAGIYTIKMRWYLSAAGTGDVWSRTLQVIAPPA